MKRSKARRRYLAQPLKQGEKKKSSNKARYKSLEQFLTAQGFANGMNGRMPDDV